MLNHSSIEKKQESPVALVLIRAKLWPREPCLDPSRSFAGLAVQASAATVGSDMRY